METTIVVNQIMYSLVRDIKEKCRCYELVQQKNLMSKGVGIEDQERASQEKDIKRVSFLT